MSETEMRALGLDASQSEGAQVMKGAGCDNAAHSATKAGWASSRFS